MFDKIVQRENKIMDILNEFSKDNLFFIVIGGYAVSAYKHRFSVDADLIIRMEDKKEFEDILKKNDFFKTIIKALDHLYAPEFMRYETREKLPVSFDLMINGAGSRDTDASFSINELEKHSKRRKIIGIEKEVEVLVPDKEIIISLKLHAGRLTDFRDIVALSKGIDIEKINNFIWKGNTKPVIKNIEKLLEIIENKNFIGGFKGVFMEKKYDIDIEKIKEFRKLLKETKS